MKAFKKRGALTHFQILSEISKQNPHLKQKDLAKTLGITIQAVSENIKTLIEQEYITSKDGRSPYKITQKGIDKVKRDAISLRKYSNIYMETSTVGDLKAIINACEIIGYDRVVFGSDYPFGKHVLKNYNYRIELNSFIEIFTPMQIEKICYENILHILDQSSKKYIQVRKAKKTDIENIFFIFDNLSEVDKKYLALSSKRTLIRQQIRNERHCYVAEIQGKIVGFLRESGRPGGYSLLEEIVVSPRYRNKGIATELLRFFHNIFHNNLAKTNSSNTTMIYLLKKHGYIAQNPDAPRIINWLRKANR